MRTAVAIVIVFFAIGFAHGQGRYGGTSTSNNPSSLTNPYEKSGTNSTTSSSNRYGGSSKSTGSSFNVKPITSNSANSQTKLSGQSSASNKSSNSFRTTPSSSSSSSRYNSSLTQPSATSSQSSKRSSSSNTTKSQTPSSTYSNSSKPKSSNSGYSNQSANSSATLGTSNTLRSNQSVNSTKSNNSNRSSTYGNKSSSARSGNSNPSTYGSPRTTTNSASSRTGRSSSTLASSTASRRDLGSRERDAHEMLTNMLKAPRSSRLSGTPTKLASIVSLGETREKQSQIIDAYWALSSATTDYYLGLHEANELENLKKRVNTYSNSLNEAIIQHATRTDTSLKAARAAQLRLARLTGSSVRVLPIDTPFCGPYVTRFKEKFPSGSAPEEARILNELIPLRLGELEDAVDAVKRSEEWLAKVAADRAKNTTGTGMIRALELLALNRRAMVMITRDYNWQINRYSQIATPGNIDTRRLVAMLIRTPAGTRSSSIASGRTFDNAQGSDLQFRPSGYGSRY